MISSILDKIYEITDRKNVLTQEEMSKHTSFKVGGPADVVVIPQGINEAADIVRLLLHNKIPYFLLGNGSNLLVSDKGYRGVIVKLSKGMDDIVVEDNIIRANAGAMLSRVASVAMENSLSGLVFASGIPGTVGGAVVMNAGAYGGEMKDVIKEVTLLDCSKGEIVTVAGSDMNFSYRHSICKEKEYVVLSAAFQLSSGNRDEIKSEIAELAQKRRDKQPLEYPSAGSTFKRPEGYFAGKLIEDAGLKGYSVGGAQVSEKHCGFVINKGNASAEDIITLIRDVRDIVNDKYKVILEPEVCMLGEGLDI